MRDRLGLWFQLNDLTWSTVPYQKLSARTMTVLFGWGIMMWNRYGGLVIVSPRAPVRLVLVGVYGWLGLSGALWLAARRMSRAPVPLRDALVAMAITHVPIVFTGFFIAVVVGFAQVIGPGQIVAILAFGVWMPFLVFRAFRDVGRLDLHCAAGAALIAHVLWLLGPGVFLHGEISHLL